MRRGLIAWSKAELPDAVFAARVARTRAAIEKAGWDALLVYSNNTRAAGASWLCGFVPYWSEAMLVLPRDGDPYLVAALTKRVHPWIAATSRIATVVSAARLGLGAGKEVAAAGGRTVGVADLDGLPAGIGDDLRGAGVTLHNATAPSPRCAAGPIPPSWRLRARAASIAHDALACALPEHDDASDMIAAVEGRARALAAEECYVAAAPDLSRARRFMRLEGEAPLGRDLRHPRDRRL